MTGVVLFLAVAAVAACAGILLGILIARALTRRLDQPDEEDKPS